MRARKAGRILAVACFAIAVSACDLDEVTQEGRAAIDVLEATKVPEGFQVGTELWEGNGYGVPDFRYSGPETRITPGSITPPDGFRLDPSVAPERNWTPAWSLLAVWKGPTPEGEGSCHLRLELPRKSWTSRTTRLIKLVASCRLGHP